MSTANAPRFSISRGVQTGGKNISAVRKVRGVVSGTPISFLRHEFCQNNAFLGGTVGADRAGSTDSFVIVKETTLAEARRIIDVSRRQTGGTLYLALHAVGFGRLASFFQVCVDFTLFALCWIGIEKKVEQKSSSVTSRQMSERGRRKRDKTI